jgi:uncharacterized protein (TIGR02145 family)
MRRFINALLLGSIVIITFYACKEEESNSGYPTNPTNGKTKAIFNPNITYGTMTDKEGNVYKTVTIGTQTWMAENLRSIKFNDGSEIPNITGSLEWIKLTTSAFCNYSNTSNLDTIATYGRLYNWYAVNSGKLAPKGWHVPTDDEWRTLISYIGGESKAILKLSETGITHWNNAFIVVTNETGFTAIPGGMKEVNSEYSRFSEMGQGCGYWSSTVNGNTEAYSRYLKANFYNFWSNSSSKKYGFSVRCIKD